jgi:hypothetical protein
VSLMNSGGGSGVFIRFAQQDAEVQHWRGSNAALMDAQAEGGGQTCVP